MLICDGFELFKRPYCLCRLNSTLNSTKNNGGESRHAPKGEYRRYSGLVPDYTSTKTSYSVVYLIRGYFIIPDRTFVCQAFSTIIRHFFRVKRAYYLIRPFLPLTHALLDDLQMSIIAMLAILYLPNRTHVLLDF